MPAPHFIQGATLIGSLWLIVLLGLPAETSSASDVQNNVPPTEPKTNISTTVAPPTSSEPTSSGNGKIEVVMTPSWALDFSEGETVSVDCGVFTAGKHKDFKIQWLDQKLQQLKPVERINVTNNFDAVTAYSVLTLTISGLVSSDSQNYTCQVETNQMGQLRKGATTIAIQVNTQAQRCGFEEQDLCGWHNEPNASFNWQRRHGLDTAILDRSRGPRYDHTYGPSKHIGHFVDVDLEQLNNPDVLSKALLVSPKYPASPQPMCLHFWSVIDGTDQDQLVLSSRAEGATNWTEHIHITEITGAHWVHHTVDIPPQNSSFWLRFEAHTCTGKCDKAAVALDDIALEATYCEKTTIHWPNVDLKLRLVDGGPSVQNGQPTQGRVEVLHDGQYGTLCSRQFGNNEAKVVCRGLGFTNVEDAVKTRNSTFGKAAANSRIWLKKLQCSGEENDLSLCIAKNETWGNTAGCTHEEDAGVICVPPGTLPHTVNTASSTAAPTSTRSNDTPQKSSPLPSSTQKKNTVQQRTTLTITSTAAASPKSSTQVPKSTSESTSQPQPSSTTGGSTTSGTTIKAGSSKPTLKSSTASSTVMSTPKPSHVVSTVTSRPVVIDADLSDDTAADIASAAGRIGRGVIAGIVLIVLLALTVLAVLVYKGRKRRLRKSKYMNFGSASYSREHLPTNEFHLESPLTMSSMGYTVLA